MQTGGSHFAFTNIAFISVAHITKYGRTIQTVTV
jgi:hypothetical protein